jgi:hypothetical protein
MTTAQPKARGPDEEQLVRSKRALGDSSDRTIVNWGLGVVPPFSIRQRGRGIETPRRLTPAMFHLARQAGHWTLRHLSRVITFPRPGETSPDQRRSEQTTGRKARRD